MADMAGRLRLLERKLDFIMDNMHMKAAISSGVLGPDGKPQVRVFQGTLRELFYMAKELPTLSGDDVPENVVEAAKDAEANGSDNSKLPN